MRIVPRPKHALRLLRSLALCAALPSLTQIPPVQAQPQPQPLALSTIIHGFAFDRDNNLVALDQTTIPRLQDAMLQKLRADLAPDAQRSFDAKAADLMAKAGTDPGRQNWARFVLIASLANGKSDQSVAVQNIHLASRLSALTKDPITAPAVLAGNRPAWMGNVEAALKNPFGTSFPGIPTRRRPGYAYAQDCIAQGVPVPPPIKLNADANPSPNAANGWKVATRNAAQLAADGLPASKAQWQIHSYLEPTQQPMLGAKISEMYYWIPPANAPAQGICIANPIMDDPAAAEPRVTALGIICQSIASRGLPFPGKRGHLSHTCFWDNNGSLDSTTSHSFTDGSFLAPPEPLGAPPDTKVNLPDDNRCTECHAGENAFIIMPGDANEIAFRTYDAIHTTNNFHDHSNWYVPLVQSNWPQNVSRAYPANADPNAGANCGGCHNTGNAGRLPEVQGLNPRDNLVKFCWFVLPNFMTQVHAAAFDTPGVMSGNWDPATNPSGVPALYAACKTLFPGATYPKPAPNSPFPSTPTAWLQPNVQ